MYSIHKVDLTSLPMDLSVSALKEDPFVVC